ncbi:hypothetical protein PBRA_005039 [Plasmodiophora brassicae]|uniref:PH domain-containing protein n=1 Tax=Plasmodiophora brassicae TaxID=37360 RepID=A0A0G4IMJ5_PLABS|nr:hypothetical protein PBRA_005039 [Plasmodiophora brassicae]
MPVWAMEGDAPRSSADERPNMFVLRRRLNSELLQSFADRAGEKDDDDAAGGDLRRSLALSVSRCRRLEEELKEMKIRAERSNTMYEELLGTLRQNGIALKTVRQREDGSGDVAGSHTSRSPGVSPNRLDVSKIVSSLIEQDLKEQRRRLPVVEGFLEKLSPRKSILLVRVWQLRFVYISNNSLCYSRDRVDWHLRDDVAQWQDVHEIPLLSIRCVAPAIDDKNRQFIIEAMNAKEPGQLREFVFRAKTRTQRDMWLRGIQAHVQHCRDVVRLGSLAQQQQ